MNNTTNELLPCPFCGCQQIYNSRLPNEVREIQCVKCSASVWAVTYEEAKSTWNRRAADEWVYIKDAGLPCAGNYYATIAKPSGDVIVAEVDFDMGIWFEAGTNTSFPDWQVIAYMPRTLPAPARAKEGE